MHVQEVGDFAVGLEGHGELVLALAVQYTIIGMKYYIIYPSEKAT